MNAQIQNGNRSVVDGHQAVWYDGYWIRYYAPPEDSLANRKALIDQLTKRAFHHTEDGINTPGENLELARAAWEAETDPRRKRVTAAMLAGALFNRATDIFTTVVELGVKGVRLSEDNELMRECGECFKEALTLGRHVRHYSGEEGIDEIWGEPFKAFTLPIASFYESRYLKIAHTKRAIDEIADCMRLTFPPLPGFAGVECLIDAYAEAAKRESETMKSDPDIFRIWPDFVACGEALQSFCPAIVGSMTIAGERRQRDAIQLMLHGRLIIEYLAGARVPMPKTTRSYLDRCARFRELVGAERNPRSLQGSGPVATSPPR